MNELVQLVSQRAGIPEDKARVAVEVVLRQLEQRLPPPLASQLQNALSGKAGTGNLGDLTKGLGGLFGK